MGGGGLDFLKKQYMKNYFKKIVNVIAKMNGRFWSVISLLFLLCGIASICEVLNSFKLGLNSQIETF